jgi:hypothetical protein
MAMRILIPRYHTTKGCNAACVGVLSDLNCGSQDISHSIVANEGIVIPDSSYAEMTIGNSDSAEKSFEVAS